MGALPLWALQYRSFCGGCTAEAVLAVPLFRALGPTVLAWKLVPVAFHLGVTLLGTAVARLAGGWRPALASTDMAVQADCCLLLKHVFGGSRMLLISWLPGANHRRLPHSHPPPQQ